MSARNKAGGGDKEIARLRAELDDLKASTQMAEATGIAAGNSYSHEFNQLTPVEQSAASLGVDSTSFKPIGWLNNEHYGQLIKSNLLDDDLARRIEVRNPFPESFEHKLTHGSCLVTQAYRTVASN
jgi:hypothetical protein|tara:strand:+ start:1521 stop:1898 length:378 start_codon:yes stop_codon:yes gene_type:complete